MISLEFSPKFVRQYKKLPRQIQEKVQERGLLFQRHPFDPRLKTHKLQGAMSGYWSFSVDHSHRIIFCFQGEDVVYFYAVGSHDIYER